MDYNDLEFLEEFGDGVTQEDEIVQNLTVTCEEGIDYSFLEDVTTSLKKVSYLEPLFATFEE